MKNIELKVGIFIILTTAIIIGFISFIAYKQGLFEEGKTVVLYTDSADGISSGMAVTFSGFKIAEVSGMKLEDDGKINLFIKIQSQHYKWINSSSVFILNKPLIGTTKIIAITPDIKAKPLAKDAKLELFAIDSLDDSIKKIKPVLEKANDVLVNIDKITSTLSQRKSAVAMATGDDRSGDDLARAIAKVSTLIDSLEQTVKETRKIATNTNQHLYAKDGLMDKINGKDGLVIQLRESMKKLDEILSNGVEISSDVSTTSKDLESLKSQIEVAIKNANSLILEIDAKIPFKEKKDITLP